MTGGVFIAPPYITNQLLVYRTKTTIKNVGTISLACSTQILIKFKLIGRKENVLFNDALNTFYLMVIWCHTYGKGLLRLRGRKHAAATWDTLSD